ncbi:cbb3-type cytochrome oxidase assembly protein [Leptospirillum ferrooxidans]|jgi:nitrogen fixation-related uncharacterized protein|uniref:Uncharacterized protein n=1 Tax=Leptospirillum ferrooxidans (strain C2-3) TaxID=1162668 RepID=I0IM87_LEPFC|nr:hypothetical protein [Leptospirillum ferrooxidans]MDA8060487.1 hypothetical protein [Nitrospiraceae bacterium]BAM06386.1 hypothetical protein LFE_0671 [Leptospirillum ferrooxidans C2-3]
MKLPEGIVAYLWTATGLVSLVLVVIGIYWAYKNNQFDENIKYLVFMEDDDDRKNHIEAMKEKELEDRK